jgi:hypothetical protein
MHPYVVRALRAAHPATGRVTNPNSRRQTERIQGAVRCTATLDKQSILCKAALPRLTTATLHWCQATAEQQKQLQPRLSPLFCYAIPRLVRTQKPQQEDAASQPRPVAGSLTHSCEPISKAYPRSAHAPSRPFPGPSEPHWPTDGCCYNQPCQSFRGCMPTQGWCSMCGRVYACAMRAPATLPAVQQSLSA